MANYSSSFDSSSSSCGSSDSSRKPPGTPYPNGQQPYLAFDRGQQCGFIPLSNAGLKQENSPQPQYGATPPGEPGRSPVPFDEENPESALNWWIQYLGYWLNYYFCEMNNALLNANVRFQESGDETIADFEQAFSRLKVFLNGGSECDQVAGAVQLQSQLHLPWILQENLLGSSLSQEAALGGFPLVRSPRFYFTATSPRLDGGTQIFTGYFDLILDEETGILRGSWHLILSFDLMVSYQTPYESSVALTAALSGGGVTVMGGVGSSRSSFSTSSRRP